MSEKKKAPVEHKVKASNHDSYGVMTIISILIPLAGIIMGAIFMTKDKKVDRKLGEHLIAVGILASIVAGILISYFVPGLLFSTVTPTYVAPVTSEAIPPAPTWDVEASNSKIANGMTRAEVEAAIEKQPANCNEQEINSQKYEACTYGALADRGMIIVSYTDGVVTAKSKQTY